MKKWLIGCLVTGLILLVVGCGAMYWFVWRPLSAAGGEFVSQAKDFAKIGEADQAVNNKTLFTPAADGKLSPAQVTAFVAIQQSIFDKMGPDFATMEAKYKKMGDQADKNPGAGNFKDVMGAYADLTSLIAKAKQAQVAGLNSQNMSLEEYRWIRDQATQALPYMAMAAPAENTRPDQNAESGVEAKDSAAETNDSSDAAQKQDNPAQDQVQAMVSAETETARANAELLRPHKEILMKVMAATWLSM